ncbi:hypothetical protein L3Y34_016201 [Caenorhabditis briggsae]|uniref:Uncharacterized protein n=1 Tax=Caenorhabditis briggsae TaxID=6238 RepID=A0AAE9J0D3_CAEBR|nr:hypothetical protein L3Y34_016201 [Caenorhabditis briggsae]
MNGIENFVNARAPPQASISFEVISEETCDPPTTEGEILTEQPIKLWVTKEKMFPKLDSATTHFVFIVSTDLALGPMSPLPTKKGALFSKGMDTDMASETQRRVIRQMLAATGTSQLAQYVKELRIEDIVDKMKERKIKEKNEANDLIWWPEWTVEKGKQLVRHFFSQIEEYSRRSAVFLLAEQLRTGYWSEVKMLDEQEFVELVKAKMDIWKTNFAN